MQNLKKIYFASHNPNKVKEVSLIFNHLAPEIQLKSVSDLARKVQDQFSPKETGKTFFENAWIKANELSRLIPDECVIAEDSGLVVPALEGAPGIYSSRYGNDDKQRTERLLHEMRNIKTQKREGREAYFFASVCLLMGENKLFFQGKTQGVILDSPKGNHGFGYDPIFYIPQLKKSFAELKIQEKQVYSHRKKALDRLIRFIQSKDLKFHLHPGRCGPDGSASPP